MIRPPSGVWTIALKKKIVYYSVHQIDIQCNGSIEPAIDIKFNFLLIRGHFNLF